METEHTETVVEKAVAFVKHTLGIPDKPPDVPRNLAQEALDEIRNASLRQEIVEEKNPSYNGTIKDAADRMNNDKKVAADSVMQEAVERTREATGTKDKFLSAAERHLILSRPGGSVGRMTPLEAGLTCDDAMGLDRYTFKSVGELHIEHAANDDRTKEHLSPAELHDDGPMT